VLEALYPWGGATFAAINTTPLIYLHLDAILFPKSDKYSTLRKYEISGIKEPA